MIQTLTYEQLRESLWWWKILVWRWWLTHRVWYIIRRHFYAYISDDFRVFYLSTPFFAVEWYNGGLYYPSLSICHGVRIHYDPWYLAPRLESPWLKSWTRGFLQAGQEQQSDRILPGRSKPPPVPRQFRQRSVAVVAASWRRHMKLFPLNRRDLLRLIGVGVTVPAVVKILTTRQNPHTWDYILDRCIWCGRTAEEVANVPYGKGIPCTRR